MPRSLDRFEQLLRCPDCRSPLTRDASETLQCPACGYAAPLEGGVYNLLRSTDKAELYPGDRGDIIDFSLPGHEKRLLGNWYSVEGVFGNKWRWIGSTAEAQLSRIKPGPQRLRVRGSAAEGHVPVQIGIGVNGTEVGRWTQDRSGLFVLEADIPDAEDYRISFNVGPVWSVPADGRNLTVSLSMIRLVPREPV